MTQPKLKDIAEETGYSIATVSRSLANSASISDKTRKEVHAAAARLGYRASPVRKRSRVRKKTLHFALLSEFRVGEFYSALFCGYRDASFDQDVRISLISIRDQHKDCVRLIQTLYRERIYDGMMLFLPDLERSHYDQILKVLPSGFPIVSNTLIDNPNVATVTFDGYSGGRLAAQHFHELGYRRLGIIEGPESRPESRFRTYGFQDYAVQHPELEITWRFKGDFEFESGHEAFRDFCAGEVLPADAVFASNDSMAEGFLQRASTENITIPDDVALLGYDNLPSATQRGVRLSSIATDFRELGSASIKALKNKLSKQAYKHGTLSLIPVQLVRRASTTPQNTVQKIANSPYLHK